MSSRRERSRSRDRAERSTRHGHREDDRRGSSSSHHRSHRDRDRDERSRRKDRHEPSPKQSRRRGHHDDDDDQDEWAKKPSSSRRDRKVRQEGTPSDDEDLLDLRKLGVQPITEEDYFVKSAEFELWLRESRDKDFHEMNSDQTRRYFRKFVRRWNDGALREKYYRPPPRSPNTSTARWGTDRPLPPRMSRSASPGPRPDPPPVTRIGPSMPSGSDRQMAMEAQREADQAARKAERHASRRTALERAEELAPRLQGKEGKMAEKRATNSANKEMRDKEVGGLELDESTLMGDGSSFQAALRARDAAKARWKDKKDVEIANARSAAEERLAERKQKESETMQMLQAMARRRYG